MAKKKPEADDVVVEVEKPNVQTVAFQIVGRTPLVFDQLPRRLLDEMILRAENPAAYKELQKHKKTTPQDLNRRYDEALYWEAKRAWTGIPCLAIKRAMVDACRTTSMTMTDAKMIFFVEADGYTLDGRPLSRITKGEPRRMDSIGRSNGSPDLRVRAWYDPAWTATVKITINVGNITAEAVTNLLIRAGQFVGIGNGRQFSPKSSGQGWGMFVVK